MDPASEVAPLISVIVPTCHRNQDLIVCLEALRPEKQSSSASETLSRAETTKDRPNGSSSKPLYEVIVTDDGSQSTAEALIQKSYPWVRWLPGPRRGPAANRNSGARKASGAWALFLDDDCVPESGWVGAYAAATRNFPERSVFEGRTIAPKPQSQSDHESPLNLQGDLLWSCNFGIKRQLFLELGGFDENFPVPAMEDMDLQFRLRDVGYTSKFLFDACAQHPWRPRRGAHFCVALAKSVHYFVLKHPEAKPIFADTWGIKRMIKIVSFEFPRNLFRFRDLSSFRVLYLDLLTCVHITLTLQGIQAPKELKVERALGSPKAQQAHRK
jgi:GT2 family glycosyltransferase